MASVTSHTELSRRSYLWLITGVAGFIGSHLLETLLKSGQTVRGIDNLSSGSRLNLEEVRSKVGSLWGNFQFIEGDIRDEKACLDACQDIDFVLHHAAIGSVPISMKDPLLVSQVNVTGAINMLFAAKICAVKRFIYASSSAIYGPNPNLPLRETETPNPLSPYAATKLCNEVYASTFYKSYGLESVGLRYFNVFGERQDPNGPYAAVIPAWLHKLIRNEEVVIHGAGEQTRDFLYVANVVEANIAAAFSKNRVAGEVYNVGHGTPMSLMMLLGKLKDGLGSTDSPTRHAPMREGDIQHSYGKVDKIREHLGCELNVSVDAGLKNLITWFRQKELPQAPTSSVSSL